MPELPDIEVYIGALERRVARRRLEAVRVTNPFLLRSARPPLQTVDGCQVEEIRRVGKRIAFGLEGDLWLVLHLMIAGRLHWQAPRPRSLGKQVLAAFDFDSGSLTLTEAGKKRRASLHLVEGEDGLARHDPGGLEVLEASVEEFARQLHKENHTLKRSLTDPRLFGGIGNAYSDEILHRARLSPVAMSRKLDDGEIASLFGAARDVLTEWTERLRMQAGEEFPQKVTAFRPQMAVHGKYGEACPDCGSKVQRIRYVANETNYCARCQTGGRMLADRSMSQLLKQDWPKTLEEWEALMDTG